MIKTILLYLFGLLPFLLFIAFGFFIIYQDRKREKLEKQKLKEAKSH